MGQSLRGLVCGLAFLALVGCGDSGDGVTVDTQFVETTIETTAFPVFDAVSLATTGGAPQPAAFEGLGGSGCNTFDCANSGGTLEVCFFQGQGESSELTLDYDVCEVAGQILDGTVSTATVGSQATVTYDLVLGNVGISGTVAVSSGKCDDVLISSLFIGSGGVGATTTADLTYCGSEWPDGVMVQTTTSPGGTLIFDMVIQSNGLISIDVTDGEGNDVAVCSGDLSTDTVTCQLVESEQMIP